MKTEPGLLSLARPLGWEFWKLNEPCDWLGLFRGQWYTIEVKNPECEGHRDEFTVKQILFHKEVKQRGGRVLIWRRHEDILADSGARLSA
jgi:hypothetical protein